MTDDSHNNIIHTPVLLKESLFYLAVRPNLDYLDCTLGEGSFAYEVLIKNSPRGRLIAFDLNEKVLLVAQKRLAKFSPRVIYANRNFAEAKEVIEELKLHSPDIKIYGIYADLGISRFLLEKSGKGFSFKKDEIIDLRYGSYGIPAYEILNYYRVFDLERIFREYGEERHSKLAAALIERARRQEKIVTTGYLASVLKPLQKYYRNRKIHYLTKIFQALRIEANSELNSLKRILNDSIQILESSGRLVIISYHSLEDRLVKYAFRDFEKEKKGSVLTVKPVYPTDNEVKRNPSARSAKLRAFIKNSN